MKRYVIKTRSGLILRTKTIIETTIEKKYDNYYMFDECSEPELYVDIKKHYTLTEDKSYSQFWTTTQKTLAENIVKNRLFRRMQDKIINSEKYPYILSDKLSSEDLIVVEIKINILN